MAHYFPYPITRSLFPFIFRPLASLSSSSLFLPSSLSLSLAALFTLLLACFLTTSSSSSFSHSSLLKNNRTQTLVTHLASIRPLMASLAHAAALSC
eukprot:6204027-Pleurochrysis_carterae.AAC.6